MYTSPVNGRLVTLCVTPLSFTMFKPSVPSPVPVVAVIFHVVDGALPDTVTLWTAGEPPRPVFTTAKLPVLTASTALAKTTCQVTVGALLGLPLARLSETTVVGGLATVQSEKS